MCTGSWEGIQPGELTKLAKSTVHTTGHHAQHIKLGGRRRKGRTFRLMVFVFPSNRYMRWSPALLEMGEVVA